MVIKVNCSFKSLRGRSTFVTGGGTTNGGSGKWKSNKGRYRNQQSAIDTVATALECHRRAGENHYSMVTLYKEVVGDLVTSTVEAHVELKRLVGSQTGFAVGKVESNCWGFVHIHLLVVDVDGVEKVLNKKDWEWKVEDKREITRRNVEEGTRYITKTLFIEGGNGEVKKVGKDGMNWKDLEQAIRDSGNRSLVVSNARTYKWGSRKGLAMGAKTMHQRVKEESKTRQEIEADSVLGVVAKLVEKTVKDGHTTAAEVDVRCVFGRYTVKPSSSCSKTPSIKYFLVDALAHNVEPEICRWLMENQPEEVRKTIIDAIERGETGLELKLQDLAALAGVGVNEYVRIKPKWGFWIAENKRALVNLVPVV